MDKEIQELVDILQTYDRLKREIFTYLRAMQLISQFVPKSEFIMPLGTRTKDLFIEVAGLLERVEKVTGKPLTPELLFLRQQFLAEHHRSLERIDEMVKAAES